MSQNSAYRLYSKASSQNLNEVRLIKLKDGRYQISQWGSFGKILQGDDCILIENKIAEILKKFVPKQIKLTQIIIFRRATKEEWKNYSELKIKKGIDINVYGQNSPLYVSSKLKKLIEKNLDDLSDIEFKRELPGKNVSLGSSGPVLTKKGGAGSDPILKDKGGVGSDPILKDKGGLGSDPKTEGLGHRPLPSSNTPALPIELENNTQENETEVSINVYSPSTFKAGNSQFVQVWMFLPEHKKKVKKKALSVDNEASKLGFENLLVHLENGSEIMLSLSSEDIPYNVQKSFKWLSKISCKNFNVSIPNTYKNDKIVFTLEIYVNEFIVGEIIFMIKAGKKDNVPKPIGDKSKRFKKAFISYASKDRKQVLERVQGINATNTFEIFQDIMHLNSGERWEKRLYKEIDSCDIFFLFWSEAACESKWVLKELEYAIQQKKDDQKQLSKIHPIIIPPRVDPPSQLGHLHFNDKIVQFIIAEEAIQKTLKEG